MNRKLLILFTLLGLSATFMPWVYIPKSDQSLYGYLGDGLVTGFLFILAFILVLFQSKSSSLKPWVKNSLIAIFGIILLIGLVKIYNFNFNKDTSGEINFMISNALIGMRLGIGVYVMALASAGSLFLTSLDSGASLKSTVFSKRLVFLSFGTITTLIIFWGLSQFSREENDESMETTLRQDFKEMQYAFQTNDLDKFITYIHPVTVKPLGEENFKSAIQGARKYLDAQSVSIKAVFVDSIIHTEKNLNNIQTIVLNRIVFDRPTGDSTAFQRTLCVSEDGGKKWYYFNTTGQSFQDIKNGFPYINEALATYIPN